MHSMRTTEHVRELIRLQESRFAEERDVMRAEREGKRRRRVQGRELNRLALLAVLHSHPESRLHRSPELAADMERTAKELLGIQLPSGNVSLYNCNIDSPPDTAFTAHMAALIVQLLQKRGGTGTSGTVETLLLFLRRASPALLEGGIHTPNHRWVVASALAKLEELFGDEGYRERAFLFLNEGLDVTDYGEWTERSNSIYNAICAYYLHTVGVVFGHEPSLEAAGRTLRMMRWLLHPGDTLATEYSGRQDLGQIARMDDRYYAAFHLMAARDRDPELAALAGIAARTAPRGSLALLHWTLEPERMEPTVEAAPLSERYTVLLGEGNSAPVPDRVPYAGPVVKHPHGAPVLRHRRGPLSVTAMAGQPECLYVQYGEARLLALKLGIGWFGAGAVSFPTIERLADDRFRLEAELEGCYFGPLPEERTRAARGSYVAMPNHLRSRIGVVRTRAAMELTLHDDGLDIRVAAGDGRGIYLQAVCLFPGDEGELRGDRLETMGPGIRRLSEGTAEFRSGRDILVVEGGACEHDEVAMRNDSPAPHARTMTVNWTTPTDAVLRIRGRREE
ncbi:hypothetical protein [Cohnella fermenti]|uniref:Heparinase n=1 Tax=Cohnella fermenti TaxID=2565925 RepID=A0A4S4C3R8_9BACL|nr:hypothetical protein [Cohnella fermenti]THF82163.1 hypothetical protein E6C55_07200 [Cohnella fermenti]